MSKSSETPKSLSQAIAKLENIGQSKTKDFKDLLENDYKEILRAMEDMKPYIDDVKKKVETEVSKKKTEMETQMKENPWVVLGVVGIIAFILGWLLSSGRKDQ